MNKKGFTLIELVVVLTIIVVLSSIILFSVSQYVNRGKDANVASNLTVLIPIGEAFYTGNGNSYADDKASFCNPEDNSALENAILQMPDQIDDAPCYSENIAETTNPKGVCCFAKKDTWVACARKFADTTKAFCVDSRGMKKEIEIAKCLELSPTSDTLECP